MTEIRLPLPSAACRLPPAACSKLGPHHGALSAGGWAKLRLAFPHVGHGLGCPLGSGGSVDNSRDVRSGSSDAAYASIAAIVALFLRSSNTILSYVSRFVCHVYCRYSV